MEQKIISGLITLVCMISLAGYTRSTMTDSQVSDTSQFSTSVESNISRKETQNNISTVVTNPTFLETDMPKEGETINIQIGDTNFKAILYNNESTQSLLSQMPLVLNMSDLNGNEKYYYLSNSLPTNSQHVGNINMGDLMLYGSECLVLFYDNFQTSYSYTKLGYIEEPSELKNVLGAGDIQVTFSADN